MWSPGKSRFYGTVVLLAEDVDRNQSMEKQSQTVNGSSSSRRTWIEITWISSGSRTSKNVVLLAEDVDRNFAAVYELDAGDVVLLAEDVDRNLLYDRPDKPGQRSSSSRRTWIEIWLPTMVLRRASVVLLAEDVDRNNERLLRPTKGNCRPPRGGRG